MTLKLVTAPTEAPVSLDEFKGHLVQLQSTDNQDADLQEKLDAAIAYVSNELGPEGRKRPLITSTWDLCLDDWPRHDYAILPANLQSVTYVKYAKSDGTENTWDAALYKLARMYDPATAGDTDCGAGRLYPAYGQSWPSATLDVGEPIAIRLVAGWKDAASVPVPIKQAILMLASHWYKNRDAVVTGRGDVSIETALGVQRLISVYEDRRW